MLLAHAYLLSLSGFVTNRLASARQRAHTGQGLVEYALIVGFIAVGAIVVLGVMSGKVSDIFSSINAALPATPTH
jgi:Flp pilus assembly pilin Flp